MYLLLNIGLIEGKSGPAIAPTTALCATLNTLAAFGVPSAHTRARVAQSETEPTLILGLHLTGDLDAFSYALYKIACVLEQEAIAYYLPTQRKGGLAGPQAEEWGEFNPDLFLPLDNEQETA